MHKTELVSAVAEATGFPKAQIDRTIDAIAAEIVSTLSRGETVQIIGFGRFSAETKAGRTGTLPNGEAYQTSASKKARFHASKAVEDALNKR